MIRLVTIDPRDNVAIVTENAPKGTTLDGLVLLQDIPQAHKVTLKKLKKGDEVIRYGVTLGYLLVDVEAGSWVNENMLRLPDLPSLDSLTYAQGERVVLPVPAITTFEGFDNGPDAFA
ncbi:MAG TPA: UxaA family hydrolase, partial [Sphaerochaeta sp.]|nr:UxaA family hydrolase [Sphaerochaeta sp.]